MCLAIGFTVAFGAAQTQHKLQKTIAAIAALSLQWEHCVPEPLQVAEMIDPNP